MSDMQARLAKLSPEKRALLEQQLMRRGVAAAAPNAIPRRGHGGPCALSFPQQRLWFLEQLAPGEPTYNAVLGMRVHGPLDLARLERGLRTVIGRHEALRTVFRDPDGTPQQVVLDDWSFRLECHDLRGIAAAEREEEMLRGARDEARRPFDLANDLMLRVTALQLDDEEHVLLFLEHHIAFDGWSDGQLFRELEELYTAERDGREPVLDELPIQYADWSEWQRERLQGPHLERLASYWRETLQDAPVVLDLPLDHERPPVQAFAGAHHHFDLPGELAEGVRALARSEGATPFMVLLAAFAAGLQRWSGQSDFVFGSPIANRDRTELEHLIGFFSNTFVLRVRTGGDPTFRELVRTARGVALGAFEHHELPFEKLVEVVRPARDPRVNPIFQVNFRVQAQAPDVLALPGMTIEAFDLDIGFSRFDLAIEFQLRDDRISGYLEYNEALFEDGTARRLGARLARLLADGLQRPDTPLGELAWEAGATSGGIRGRRGR
jgi:hypothetical protein